jgi:hypothetical protein
MKYQPQSPFDSLESAHEFVALFAEAIADSRREVEADVARESASGFPRRLEAVRLALYNLERLQVHVAKSRRILNDLRCLRRLLLEERKAGALTAVPMAVQESRIETPARPVPQTPSPARPAEARTRGVAAA